MELGEEVVAEEMLVGSGEGVTNSGQIGKQASACLGDSADSWPEASFVPQSEGATFSFSKRSESPF